MGAAEQAVFTPPSKLCMARPGGEAGLCGEWQQRKASLAGERRPARAHGSRASHGISPHRQQPFLACCFASSPVFTNSFWLLIGFSCGFTSFMAALSHGLVNKGLYVRGASHDGKCSGYTPHTTTTSEKPAGKPTVRSAFFPWCLFSLLHRSLDFPSCPGCVCWGLV